jgi:hypothetical protein
MATPAIHLSAHTVYTHKQTHYRNCVKVNDPNVVATHDAILSAMHAVGADLRLAVTTFVLLRLDTHHSTLYAERLPVRHAGWKALQARLAQICKQNTPTMRRQVTFLDMNKTLYYMPSIALYNSDVAREDGQSEPKLTFFLCSRIVPPIWALSTEIPAATAEQLVCLHIEEPRDMRHPDYFVMLRLFAHKFVVPRNDTVSALDIQPWVAGPTYVPSSSVDRFRQIWRHMPQVFDEILALLLRQARDEADDDTRMYVFLAQRAAEDSSFYAHMYRAGEAPWDTLHANLYQLFYRTNELRKQISFVRTSEAADVKFQAALTLFTGNDTSREPKFTFFLTRKRIFAGCDWAHDGSALSPIQYDDGDGESRLVCVVSQHSAYPVQSAGYFAFLNLLAPAYAIPGLCDHCHQPSPKRYHCGACGQGTYCSRLCQSLDWPRHQWACERSTTTTAPCVD